MVNSISKSEKKMGTRIHKVIGYGLTDIKTGYDYNITDSRINPDGILGISYEKRDTYEVNQYKIFLENKKELEMTGERLFLINLELANIESYPERYEAFQYKFKHDAEYGLPEVLCIVPPMYTEEWCRYDDMIDIVEEEVKRHQNPSHKINHVYELKKGIYPWEYSYQNEHGEPFRFHSTTLEIAYYSSSHLTEEELDELVKQLYGYADWYTFKKSIKPVVPYCVHLFCEFCELFTEINYIRDLRPILYTYWS